MVNARSGVPRGYQAVMPYLRVRDAASAIKFYKKVFGAEERFRLKMAGKVGHAELVMGGAVIMLSDEFPEAKAVGPQALRGTSVVMTVYVDDVDRLVAKAVKAGAKVRRPVADQFYGDRTGQIEDPFGHVWSIQTRVERVSPKEMQKRLNDLLRAEASASIAKRKGTARPAGAASKKTSAAKTRRNTAKIAVEKVARGKAKAAKTETARQISATASAKSRKVPNKAGRRARKSTR
jgi:PhnB protein